MSLTSLVMISMTFTTVHECHHIFFYVMMIFIPVTPEQKRLILQWRTFLSTMLANINGIKNVDEEKYEWFVLYRELR